MPEPSARQGNAGVACDTQLRGDIEVTVKSSGLAHCFYAPVENTW